MKKTIFGVMISIVFMGCNTTPVTVSNAIPIDQGRALAFQNKPTENFGTIIVIRDEGMTGGGCFIGLHINGKLAARIDTKEIVKFYVEPGEILFKVGRDPMGRGLCSTGQDHWTQRESFIKSNEIKYFRISTDGGSGKFDIIRAD